MGFFKTMSEAFSEGIEQGMGQNLAASHQSRKRLSDQDIDSFMHAANERPKLRTVQDVRKRLTERNALRMMRLQKDYRWMQKEMRRMGLNPEDARWVLGDS